MLAEISYFNNNINAKVGIMTKDIDTIKAAVAIIIKAAVLVLQFSGRIRKRKLKQIAKMDIDEKDEEIIFLRDKVHQLKTRTTIFQKVMQANQNNKLYTVSEKLHILFYMEMYQIPRRKVKFHLGISRSTFYRWLHKIEDQVKASTPVNKTPTEIASLIWEMANKNVGIGHYSRKVMAVIPLEGPNAGWNINAFESAIEKYGAPKHLILDQAGVFTGDAFGELVAIWERIYATCPRFGGAWKFNLFYKNFIIATPPASKITNSNVSKLKYLSMSGATESPYRPIKPATKKNRADRLNAEAMQNIRKFILNTPADTVMTLYGIGVNPATATTFQSWVLYNAPVLENGLITTSLTCASVKVCAVSPCMIVTG